MINVTKTFLPPFEEYTAVLKRAWDKGWITNNGELVRELEEKLKQYLGVKHLLFCNNGTIALQIALKALNIKGEVITTPFSYVATTGVILWENCMPVFVDIDENNFCIDASKIEEAITDNTSAILATHVYGHPCDIDAIQKIADKHSLKVIYDGAHAFGCNYKGRSLLDFGSISTCSFHATKLFHTVEGGCIICHDEELLRKLYLYRQFGHEVDDYLTIGINGKNSEFHAAMGLSMLPKINDIIDARRNVVNEYSKLLEQAVRTPQLNIPDFEYNYSYYPVVFNNESSLLKAKQSLMENGIGTRRYFYPSLNMLPYLENTNSCPVSEAISKRILCLPLYYDLTLKEVNKISRIILNTLLN